ncbi:unnamed protein product [Mytilus coruscus]|uniref:CCHC-type domain-containing protein n=1 Tax=Mytilus coruscus TaxID=42192 RepID=A0A6J8B8U6_MYTCO|nr:unnamed protein product [Mytilus coruscus]
MSLVNINTCSFQELLQLPGIGIKTGEQIMDIRDGKGFVTEADLATISHLRVTMALIAKLDFSTNGGGQNIGPPPEARGKHQSMINTIIDGGMVASPGMPCQTHSQSVFKQEGWHQGQSPGAWGRLSQLNSAFLEYSSYHEEASSRPETPANWSGVYGEQLPQKEWGHHNAGDPNQGNHPHPGGSSSIGYYLYWPGEDSAWEKSAPPKGGTPSYSRGHPMVHASNYTSQGSSPGTQPANTGLGQYETPHSRYGKWQDNRDEYTRQTPARTYGDRQDNRGEDTRQTPARTYGDRQRQGRYNQGNTSVPPQGVTARGSYGQQAYPVAYNEDRPRENTKGPNSRGGSRGVSSSASKVSNAPKNIKREVRQVMSGRYEDHPEAYHEYQVPHERATMAPERAPASAWKAELEKTDRKFDLVHEKLDDIMDQFKKLLPCLVAGSPSPGRLAGAEGCHHCGERGHFKTECPKFGGKYVSGSLSPHRGPPWEGVCYHCFQPGHVRKDCLDFQGRDKTFRDQSSRTATGPLNFNGTTQEAGVRVPANEVGPLSK